MDLKIILSLLQKVENMPKMLENQRMCRKTVMDHPGYDTKYYYYFWTGSFLYIQLLFYIVEYI